YQVNASVPKGTSSGARIPVGAYGGQYVSQPNLSIVVTDKQRELTSATTPAPHRAPSSPPSLCESPTARRPIPPDQQRDPTAAALTRCGPIGTPSTMACS